MWHPKIRQATKNIIIILSNFIFRNRASNLISLTFSLFGGCILIRLNLRRPKMCSINDANKIVHILYLLNQGYHLIFFCTIIIKLIHACHLPVVCLQIILICVDKHPIKFNEKINKLSPLIYIFVVCYLNIESEHLKMAERCATVTSLDAFTSIYRNIVYFIIKDCQEQPECYLYMT